MNRLHRAVSFSLLLGAVLAGPGTAAEAPRPVFVVPNFHPASCGWLTDWSTERNYCANSYFDHLDRVRDDPTYNFALSECNNLIAMRNFRPERWEELKQRIREGRVELCNAFFLEPTVNLSGGEALVKMGVEGLRWQQQVLGVRPRFSWMIDVTGLHEQMAQIVTGLGLEALVYCRGNPSGRTLHWFESPDGTRALAISPGHYLEWRPMFGAKAPLAEPELRKLAADIEARIVPLPPEQDRQRPNAADLRSPPRRTPPGTPVLILGGSGDYNLAPLCRDYPGQFLRDFQAVAPEYDVSFTTPGKFLDAISPFLRSGEPPLPVVRTGTGFTYLSFWIQNPQVKSSYRRSEQQLQAAEMLATAASLTARFDYPVQPLYHGWLQMLLNMDRNTLWGAAGGMVFEHEQSWDVRDRFESVDRISGDTLGRAAQALGAVSDRAVAGADRVTVFNPLNWPRHDAARLATAVGETCQALPGTDDVLCRLDLPATGLAGFSAAPVAPPRIIALPNVIETRFLRVRLDPATGALTSLQLKATGRELLAGPANVIVAERPKKRQGSPGDQMVNRAERERVADSNQTPSTLTVTTGPLATVVAADSRWIGGGRLRRLTIIHHDQARIDFETELNDIPDRTVVIAEFPLAGPVREVRRGIPYGFSVAAWPEPTPAQPGYAKGITPAVRWSHYQMSDAGVALLDQGLSGREITGDTPVIFLLNAAEKYHGYPNAWLSGVGRRVLRYALVAHAGEFATARIPQAAWEFNQPPLVVGGGAPAKPRSFVQTSDNVIVEALRREGGDIELRLAECLGQAGTATVTLNLPHRDAALTDLMGAHRQKLAGGPRYTFPVRAQQIVTLRFRPAGAVAEITPLLEWDELVPVGKRAALRRYLPEVKGHPPSGGP